MIKLSNLEIGYFSTKGTVSVYKDLNTQFNRGDVVGLIGNNGVGKSTLLKTITGNLPPLSGNVFINQKNSKEYSPQELAKIISIVITEKVNDFNLTTWDVVSAGRTPYLSTFASLSKEDAVIVEESLNSLQIVQLKDKLIDELSDGQRQKVMIAKSLAQQTPIIILDEPTAFLDYQSKHHLFLTLKKLAENQHKLIIVSSHDLDLMKQYTSQTLELISSHD